MSFEERSRQAMDRRRVPADSDAAINLSDQSHLTPDQPTTQAQEPTRPEPAQQGKLRYAALEGGPGFFNEDGTEHQFASEEEKTRAMQAMAHHMATGEQTPGAPELDLAMLDEDGHAPILHAAPDPLPDAGPVPPRGPDPLPPNPNPAEAQRQAPPIDLTRYRPELGADGVRRMRHVDDGDIITEAQFDAEHARQRAARPAQPSPEALGARAGAAPSERGPVDPRLVIGDRPIRGRDSGSWEVNERDYVGVTIKPIREVLANERDAQFFGETLRALGHPDVDAVLRRYHEGTPSNEDNDFLTFGAHEYSRSLKIAEETVGLVTKEDVELLGRRNKDILTLITHEGDARAIEIVKNSIFHTAMRHPADVEDMRDSMKALKKDRETYLYKRTEQKVDALCKHLNISRKDYGSVYDLRSTEARRETKADLEQRFHENAGSFRRALDWTNQYMKMILPGSSRHAAIRAMMQAEKATPDMGPRAWMLGRIDSNLESIADHLGPTVGNPEMRRLISQEVLANQNTIPTTERGPRTFAQTQALTRDRFAPATIENRIRQRIQADGARWASRPPAEQDSMLREMRNTEAREQGGGGFWAWLFGALFGQNFNNAASAAAGRPVRV